MVSLVVDYGALVQERRELQNGADAAALALGADCARGACGDFAATARELADDNATDNLAGLDVICGVGPILPTCATAPARVAGLAGWVFVRTKTSSAGSGEMANLVPFHFAAALGNHDKGQQVTATAVSAWGPPSKLVVAPIAISTCEFFEVMGGAGGTLSFPSAERTMNFHTTASNVCPHGPAGKDAPGGFGWLDVGSQPCTVDISRNTWYSTDPGNSKPHSCDLTTWRNAEISLPIYDSVTGTGNNISYHVIGFGRLHVTGYKFPSERWSVGGGTLPCPGEAGNSGTCLRGYFTRFILPTPALGSGQDFGVRGVTLVG